MNRFAAVLLRVLVFAAVGAMWFVVAETPLSVSGNAVCIASVLAIYPAVFVARALLDRKPTPLRAVWITVALHAVLMLCFGTALIKSVQTYAAWRLLVLPVPGWFAIRLVFVTGVAAFVCVANLALKGFGAPFALALSRKLATSWAYSHTRNPMVLAVILWFLSIGLMLQSAGFVLWVLVLAAPAELTFLKVYEERELEIRFGDYYRAYKAATPFLLPGKKRAPV
jgi:protein-S-isoprenylcysteine O-methyltransferase Ste14